MKKNDIFMLDQGKRNIIFFRIFLLLQCFFLYGKFVYQAAGELVRGYFFEESFCILL